MASLTFFKIKPVLEDGKRTIDLRKSKELLKTSFWQQNQCFILFNVDEDQVANPGDIDYEANSWLQRPKMQKVVVISACWEEISELDDEDKRCS